MEEGERWERTFQCLFRILPYTAQFHRHRLNFLLKNEMVIVTATSKFWKIIFCSCGCITASVFFRKGPAAKRPKW
jgi:hypothetical protein